MNRNLQSLLVSGVGGVLLWLALSGTYVRYVRVGAKPWLVAAAVALVLLGLLLLWAENEARLAARVLGETEAALRGGRPPLAADGHDHDAHGAHGHGRAARLLPWLLVLPLLALFLVQPRALGAFTAERGRTAHLQKPASPQYAPLSATRVNPMDLTTLNERALYDDPRALRGKRIALTGFVTPREGGGTYVNRLLIVCCAADAVPLRARLTGLPGRYKAGTWVAVTGTYTGTESEADPSQDPVPVLHMTSVRRIPEPRHPYAT